MWRHRVPVVVFLSEDGFEVGRYGDRTLSKYRQVVASQAGAACPTGIGSPGHAGQIGGAGLARRIRAGTMDFAYFVAARAARGNTVTSISFGFDLRFVDRRSVPAGLGIAGDLHRAGRRIDCQHARRPRAVREDFDFVPQFLQRGDGFR